MGPDAFLAFDFTYAKLRNIEYMKTARRFTRVTGREKPYELR